MKNIPVFTAANGIASLVLAEIPVSGKAYVLVRSVWTTAQALLDECIGFCRAVGAEAVFASWETETLPGAHAYDLLGMACRKAELPEPTQLVPLEPLTPDNGSTYLEIYNRCFAQVPGAATYTRRDLQRLFDQDKAWLALQDGEYAAIAEISEEGLEAIGVLPRCRGLGFDLAASVLPMVPSLTVRLKVASTNLRAIALYERLGFVRERVVSRWWKVL